MHHFRFRRFNVSTSGLLHTQTHPFGVRFLRGADDRSKELQSNAGSRVQLAIWRSQGARNIKVEMSMAIDERRRPATKVADTCHPHQ